MDYKEEIIFAIEQIKEELLRMSTTEEKPETSGTSTNNEEAIVENENILSRPEEIERILHEVLSSHVGPTTSYDCEQSTSSAGVHNLGNVNDNSSAFTTENIATTSFENDIQGGVIDQEFCIEFFDDDDDIAAGQPINYYEAQQMPPEESTVSRFPAENREIGACDASYVFEAVHNLTAEEIHQLDLVQQLSDLINLSYKKPSDPSSPADDVPTAKSKENDNNEMMMMMEGASGPRHGTVEDTSACPSTSVIPPRAQVPALKSKRKLSFDDENDCPKMPKILKPSPGQDRLMAELEGIGSIRENKKDSNPEKNSNLNTSFPKEESEEEEDDEEEEEEEEEDEEDDDDDDDDDNDDEDDDDDDDDDTPADDQSTSSDELKKYFNL